MRHERKERTARRAPGDNVLPDQFQTVAAVLASDWYQKTCVFFTQFTANDTAGEL